MYDQSFLSQTAGGSGPEPLVLTVPIQFAHFSGLSSASSAPRAFVTFVELSPRAFVIVVSMPPNYYTDESLTLLTKSNIFAPYSLPLLYRSHARSVCSEIPLAATGG